MGFGFKSYEFRVIQIKISIKTHDLSLRAAMINYKLLELACGVATFLLRSKISEPQIIRLPAGST
jgi:hypothetical protein